MRVAARAGQDGIHVSRDGDDPDAAAGGHDPGDDAVHDDGVIVYGRDIDDSARGACSPSIR